MKWKEFVIQIFKKKLIMVKKKDMNINEHAKEHNELSLELQKCQDKERREEILKKQQELHLLMNPEGEEEEEKK